MDYEDRVAKIEALVNGLPYPQNLEDAKANVERLQKVCDLLEAEWPTVEYIIENPDEYRGDEYVDSLDYITRLWACAHFLPDKERVAKKQLDYFERLVRRGT